MPDIRRNEFNETAYVIFVLIAFATSENSDEPAHTCSLVRAFAVCTHEARYKMVDKSIRHFVTSPI